MTTSNFEIEPYVSFQDYKYYQYLGIDTSFSSNYVGALVSFKNKQFIFLADTDNKLNELTLNEGQKLGYFTLKKIKSMPNVAPAVIEAIDIYKKFLV